MEHARDHPGVTITNETEDFAILSINGPKSRDLLGELTSDDVSAKGFKFMENRRMMVGGVDVLALCVSYTGKVFCVNNRQLYAQWESKRVCYLMQGYDIEESYHVLKFGAYQI